MTIEMRLNKVNRRMKSNPPIVVSSDVNSVVPEFDEHKETTKINSKEYVPVKDTIVESKPRTPIKIKRAKEGLLTILKLIKK